jgi:glucokinase
VTEIQRKVKKRIQGIGLGIAGQVSTEGVVRFAPNLMWKNVPLKKILEESLGIPVFVTNDVRAATIGEWIYGAGKGFDNVVVLFVGTGVGGGVVSDGKIMDGCNNSAGELGHTTIIFDGRKCRCPNYGCLEAYVGGWAIAERTQNIICDNPDSGHTLIGFAGSVENISAFHVSQAFNINDPLAMEIVKDTGRYLSAGIVSITNALNPCKLVLVGGVIEGLPSLIHMVKKTVKERALQAALEKLTVSKSALGENAGIIGSAALAQKNLEKIGSISFN